MRRCPKKAAARSSSRAANCGHLRLAKCSRFQLTTGAAQVADHAPILARFWGDLASRSFDCANRSRADQLARPIAKRRSPALSARTLSSASTHRREIRKCCRTGQELRKSNSLIATALRLLTDDVTNQEALKTSLGTLTRVLQAINWHTISKDKPEAWLYFYEDFLDVYDNKLRKRTGSGGEPAKASAASAEATPSHTCRWRHTVRARAAPRHDGL